MEFFLSNRTQQVKVNDDFSEIAPVLSGVPQGSVLGPTLFLIFVNDIVDNLPLGIDCALFADDVKMSIPIATDRDAELLQVGLECVKVWANTWQMTLNTEKCGVLTIGKSSGHNYFLGNTQLSSFLEMRDLGVTIDPLLRFSSHCSKIYQSAFCRTSLLFRCFLSKNTELLLRAYLVYVRPILEYATEVFSPFYEKDIERLEKVQRYFTRRLKGLSNLSYRDRLDLLKLESLEDRRIKRDLIFCYKIKNGLVDIPETTFFPESNLRSLRGHSQKLPTIGGHTNVRQSVFAVRVVPHWNSLPQSVINISSLPIFKAELKRRQFVDYNRYT